MRKMASRACLLVSSSLGTVVPERLDTRYCDPANRTRNLLACATVQEPRSESNAFDESASRGLRAVCALSQPIGKAMSAISARGRVLVPGQLGGMVVVTLVPRRHAGRAAWWSSAPGSCSACAKKSCHVQRHMAALRSAHMGSATQIPSSGTETKLVGHTYGESVAVL